MNQKKKIKFNHNNLLIGIVLLTLVTIIGPNFVDPRDSVGQMFYFFNAVVTAFLFPWMSVVDEEDQDASKG
jgi:uncharacterized membrane protein